MNSLKKYHLKSLKNYLDIAEYCSDSENTEFCRKERLYICKTTLNNLGLRTDIKFNSTTEKTFDFFDILNELINLSKEAGIKKTDPGYLNPRTNDNLRKKIKKSGSVSLKMYLRYNDVNLETRMKNSSTIDIVSKTTELV